MKKIAIKLSLYGFLILISLELLVRFFYLGKDTPTRFLDTSKVEKWTPNQQGYAVTGNRRQNFAEFNINSSGFNSYREFSPTKEKFEIAIVGDSFIEGFHQNYDESIGKKIELLIPNIEVYEYGYAGYDFADQLHLIHAYKDDFDRIDHVILGIKFKNDLTRDSYKVIQERLALESTKNRLLKKSKLLVYCNSIGVIDIPKDFIRKLKNWFSDNKKTLSKNKITTNKAKKYQTYIDNFENLVRLYGFDKKRFSLLLDSRITDKVFLKYLELNEYLFIDFANAFESSSKNTDLIYDKHWNDHGRTLISLLITDHINSIYN